MDNNPKEMVTKKEFIDAIGNLVTKKEFNTAIARMVTKEEFSIAMDGVHGRFQGMDKRFQSIEEKMFTKDDHSKFVKGLQIWQKRLEDEMASIREEMYTKKDHARDLVWMDKAMTEIEAAREERLLYGRQVLRIDDKVFDHEKRIRALENG